MRRIKLVMGALLASAALLASIPALAQRGYHGQPSYGRPYYHHDNGGRNFVRGAIVGGVVTGLIYEANRPVYRPAPVYYSNGYAIDPTWIVTYRSSYDPYCRCNVLIRYYQDAYGNLHSYP